MIYKAPKSEWTESGAAVEYNSIAKAMEMMMIEP